MRIALIGTRGVPARYGGFETCVEEVGRRLVKAGHVVVVYCRTMPEDDDASERLDSYQGMELVHLPALHRKSLETLSHTALSVAHLAMNPVDAAIVFNAANAPLLPLIRARGIPVATHVDGLEWKRAKWAGAGKRYYRRAEALAVRWSDALIADAQGIADYYDENYGAPTELIAYGAPILYGDGTDKLDGVGVAPQGYHLVVARFEPENHVHLIIEGYRRSTATLPLVVVGSAPYADEYTAHLHTLGDERVRFLGPVWDQDLLDQLYANSRTYLHGHSVGGTNPSLLRAIGAGAATIAYDVNFNREVLEETGRYFVTPADVAREVEAAEADPDSANRRGRGARDLARRYDWDDVAVKYEALCMKLVAMKPGRQLPPASPPRARAKGRSARAVRAGADAPTAHDVTHAGRPERVLVAHPSPDLYGSDRQLIESIGGLRDEGLAVTVALPSSGPLVELLDADVRILPFSVLRKSLLRPLAMLLMIVSAPAELVRLTRFIRAQAPDVVYVNTVTIPLWVLAARLAGKRVLVHVHEAEEDAPRLVRAGLVAPLLLASKIVTNSEASRTAVVAALPRLKRRIIVVPNGVSDPGPQASERSVAGQLTLVGRLSPRKGTDVALEALALLRREGRAVELEICGTPFAGYEWFEAELRERASQADLAGAVRFSGYVNPTGPVLAAANVVIVPSRTEPFGLTAVEGMLAGRPVVASRVQGLAEIIVDGRTGLLVEPGDPQALASAIARLLDCATLAGTLAEAGRLAALERFGADRYRGEITAVVVDLSHAKSGLAA